MQSNFYGLIASGGLKMSCEQAWSSLNEEDYLSLYKKNISYERCTFTSLLGVWLSCSKWKANLIKFYAEMTGWGTYFSELDTWLRYFSDFTACRDRTLF